MIWLIFNEAWFSLEFYIAHHVKQPLSLNMFWPLTFLWAFLSLFVLIPLMMFYSRQIFLSTLIIHIEISFFLLISIFTSPILLEVWRIVMDLYVTIFVSLFSGLHYKMRIDLPRLIKKPPPFRPISC